MRVEEIRFNNYLHCGNFDAINTEQDLLRFRPPGDERAAGKTQLSAVYAKSASNNEITIKVSFSGGPSDQRRRIGAIVPRLEEGLCDAPIGDSHVHSSEPMDVLGSVCERDVAFDCNGLSAPQEFRLPVHHLRGVGVGRYLQHWRWRFKDQSNVWNDFDETYHTIYVTMGVPTLPWSQQITGDDSENLRLPWINAMGVACRWARGATTEEEVAAMITQAVNAHPRLVYDSDPKFLFGDKFLLSCFIDQIEGNRAFRVNCEDCASVVVTLANLLGCDLSEGKIGAAGDFYTNRVLTIGQQDSASNWITTKFKYHEVAWLHDIGLDKYVYDACLRVDMNYDDASKDPLPKLPVAMRFSPCAIGGYAKALIRIDELFHLAKKSLRRELL